MVKYVDFEEFYTVHYLPYLLRPGVNLCDETSVDMEERLDEYILNNYGDETDLSRIQFPRELIVKELKDELTYNADPDEVASAILLNFPEYASDVLGFDVEDYLDVSDDDEYDKREEEVIGLIKENLS